MGEVIELRRRKPDTRVCECGWRLPTGIRASRRMPSDWKTDDLCLTLSCPECEQAYEILFED